MNRHIPIWLLLFCVTSGCSQASRTSAYVVPEPIDKNLILPIPGYRTHLLNETFYHPPATFYLGVQPSNDGSGVKPTRDDAQLEELWHKAARKACGGKSVEIIYGPHFSQFTDEYCEPFPGEADCASSIYAYFVCR